MERSEEATGEVWNCCGERGDPGACCMEYLRPKPGRWLRALTMALRVASVTCGPGEERWLPPWCAVGFSVAVLKDRAWLRFCDAVVIPFTRVGLIDVMDEGGVEK